MCVWNNLDWFRQKSIVPHNYKQKLWIISGLRNKGRLKTILLQRKAEMPHLADPLANSSLPSTILHVTFLSQTYLFSTFQLSICFVGNFVIFRWHWKRWIPAWTGRPKRSFSWWTFFSTSYQLTVLFGSILGIFFSMSIDYCHTKIYFSTQVSRLSSKAGRAQEHRRKQYVANFEVQTNKNNLLQNLRFKQTKVIIE